ncbi:MAG: chorismate mutase [Alphaproteobacteria bacterium]
MKHCTTMAEVREQIDDIDRRIVALLAERSGYVSQAARIKATRAEIVDHARIEEVVAKARAAAGTAGLDADLAERIFRPMVDAFIAFETDEYERRQTASGD